jgi:hypothetical protein
MQGRSPSRAGRESKDPGAVTESRARVPVARRSLHGQCAACTKRRVRCCRALGRQHWSSACKAGNTGLADLALDERLTLTRKDSHTGSVARQDVERQTKGEDPLSDYYKVLKRCLQPAVPLCLILRFPIRYRLPLHIERCIRSPAFERMDVIDDVSGTAAVGISIGRARMLTLEVVLSSRAALVAAMPSRPRAVTAEGRAMAMPLPRSGEGIERGE